MTHPPTGRLLKGLMCLFLGTGLGACAGTIQNVQPTDIPRLQQAVANAPDDTDLQVELGIAQFKAGDHEAAHTTLQSARDAGNESGSVFLYLGFVQEELEDWTAARRSYNRYLVVGESGPARQEVRKRLTLIGRNLLRAQAQQALAQEQEITATGQITPRSVAVMPMGFNSTRADLEPLVYALSDMMITDFKVSNALVVLERAQVQTLLDEMALTTSGYSDTETGARAGRMLRAEHVFQGVLTTLGDDELQADADVLNIPNTATAGSLTENAVLEQIFDMEKQIVIRTIRDVLGVTLTPAEEQAILENRMENVLAFLAYGRGLRELDNGNYEAAQQEFATAQSLEPGYFAVQAAAAETATLIETSALNTLDLSGIAVSSGEGGATLFGPPSATTMLNASDIGISPQAPLGAGADPNDDPDATPVATTTSTTIQTLNNVFENIDPSPVTSTIGQSTADWSRNPTPTQTQPGTREPVQESQGQETIATSVQAQIRIVIQRPGGEQ